MAAPPHIAVMPSEVMAYLGVRPGGTYVDCTAGAGGHAALIADSAGPDGRLLALDRDPESIALVRARFRDEPQVRVIEANYSEIDQVAQREGVEAVDGVLLDAGCSSMQLDSPLRGFSFQADGPLDMRMTPASGPSARDWIASTEQNALADALQRFGDVPYAGRIARVLCERAAAKALDTTSDLVRAIRDASGNLPRAADAVRQSFQAIRIAVNDELQHLEQGLERAFGLLQRGGRLVVIAFHSGEDSVVKGAFQTWGRPQREVGPDGRTIAVEDARGRILTKRPVWARPEETAANPRAKSARLRAIERL